MNLSVDMESHTGLRGLCALWVMLFHAFLFGSYGNAINLNGSVAMPIFFILSGFSLGVVYGGSNNDDDGDDDDRGNSGSSSSSKWNFYRNRFARIYPVYILTMCFAMGLIWTDFGFIDPDDRSDMSPWDWTTLFILNVTLINMWFCGAPIVVYTPINGPSWFLSVIWFQYAVFPFTLPYVKRIVDKRRFVFWLYVAQCVISVTLIVTTEDFFIATMNVVAPGFCMFHAGVLCGLWSHERTRERNEGQKSQSETLLEFGSSIVDDDNVDSLSVPFANKEHDMTPVSVAKGDDAKKWAKITDICACIFFSWIGISIIFTAINRKFDYGSNYVIQIFGSPFPLAFIVSLTLDNGTSTFAKVCRWTPSMWLGKIGLCLYLVHLPIIGYFTVICQKINSHLVSLTDHEPWPGGSMPYWGVFIVVPLSLLLASAIERYVETPCRRLLRSS